MKRYLTLIFTIFVCSAAPFVYSQGPGGVMPNYPFSSFRFNFINPGARATGMGQAFIAQADDATGSETNPAGLTALVRPQAFVECRYINNIFATLAPTSTEIEYEKVSASKISPTFLSFVYPKKSWAFGFYRQELANYSVTPEQQTVELPGVKYVFGAERPFNILQFSSQLKIKVENYGFSIAKRWGEKINIGASIRASRFDFQASELQDAEIINSSYVYVKPGDKYGVMQKTEGSVWSMSWVAGFILKPWDFLRIGGVYRSSSSHKYSAVFDENLYNRQTNVSLKQVIPNFEIIVPRRYGVGVALKPKDRLTFTFDLLRIEYGQMTETFVSYIQKEFQDDYGFKNGVSVRTGMEYTLFIGKVPLSVRAGFYVDPDNSLHYLGDRDKNDVFYIGTKPVPVDRIIENFSVAQEALFPEWGREYHGTFGFGVSLVKHIQLEFACDFSQKKDNVVLSFLYNF